MVKFLGEYKQSTFLNYFKESLKLQKHMASSYKFSFMKGKFILYYF